jgi:hypothetical protein
MARDSTGALVRGTRVGLQLSTEVPKLLEAPMTSRGTDKRPRRRITHTLGFAAVCAAVVAVGISAAPAVAGKHSLKTLGQTKTTPGPLCPQRPSEHHAQRHPGEPIKHACSVIGSVTGFGLKVGGHHHAFQAKESGRIVAWALSVANTNRYEEKAFGDLSFFGTKALGGAPTARLAILRKKDGPRFKLVRESEVVSLNAAQGHKQYFTLNKPLKIKKGLTVALTTQTWAPILASGSNVAKNNSWLASRHKGKCVGNTPDQTRALAIAARPQTKVTSTRQYGCRYTDRLLYWAYYNPGLH